MPDARGELSNAENKLQELEAKLRHIASIIQERKAEKAALDGQVREAGTAGDVDRLMTLQRRSVAIDREIADLRNSEAECAERVDAPRRYLYTLYVRLERLRQEANTLKMKLAKLNTAQLSASQDKLILRRVSLQIEAIAGAE
jgi:chromosome segregation ATPase